MRWLPLHHRGIADLRGRVTLLVVPIWACSYSFPAGRRLCSCLDASDPCRQE